VLLPVSDVIAGKEQLWVKDLGLGEGDGILRHFKVVEIKKTPLRETFERMLADVAPSPS
jgi:hypothetical protein